MSEKKAEKLKIDPKTLLVDVLYDIIGSVLYGAGMYTFAVSSNFAPGGVSGLAILVNYITGGKIPIGLCTVISNIPIILICIRTLGKLFFLRSVKTILISAVIVDYIMPLLPTYTGEPILAAIFGGILAGAGLAFIYMRDSSTGGSDFVILAIRKKNPQLSIGSISLAVDGVIIMLGWIVYGNINAVLYGMIMTIGYSLIVDKLMYGIDSRKLLIIVTSNGDNVARRIGEEIERGVTVADGKGAYTGNSKQILFCTCSKAEVFSIKRIAHECDSKAFVMITSVDAAYGEGFKEHDD